MHLRVRERDIIMRLVTSGVANEFHATSRRNFMIGRWAAELMARDSLAYAIELNDIDIAAAGRNDMFFKLRADLEAAGIFMSDPQLHDIANGFFNAAAEEILSSEATAAA
jgi:hypothetical protein